MKAKIIKIGNSKGIRIPKPILEQTGMPNEVDVQVEGDMIILKPARKIREGWKKAFQKMTEHGDDRLLDKESVNQPGEWEKSEWEW